MCGIVGVAGQIGMKEEKMLRTLLVLDSLRGEDSTGIAAIPCVGEAIVAKELGNPFELFDAKKFVQAMKRGNRAIIGHNRFATSGGISKSTAHPFEFDTLIGVHNGTLRNKWKLDDSADFTVDSENLYHHIEKNGLKHTLNVVDGAYALVWWDKIEETINILRNKERPMYMAGSVDNKTMFCASEAWMLTIAANRADVKIQEIIPVVEDMHYTFFIDKNGVLEKPKVKHMPSTYEAPVYNQAPWMGNQFKENKSPYKSLGNDSPPNPNTTSVTPTGKVVNFPEKKTVETSPLPAGSVAYYVGRKGVHFTVKGKCTDKNGSVYVELSDPKWPAAPLRVYPNKKDPRAYTFGKELIGEISAFVENDQYFKVSPHSIVMVPAKESPIYKYDNGKGHKLSKKEWEDKYPNCDWCFDPLFAEEHGNRLNGTGGCFCPKCAEITEAIEDTQLRAVH